MKFKALLLLCAFLVPGLAHAGLKGGASPMGSTLKSGGLDVLPVIGTDANGNTNNGFQPYGFTVLAYVDVAGSATTPFSINITSVAGTSSSPIFLRVTCQGPFPGLYQITSSPVAPTSLTSTGLGMPVPVSNVSEPLGPYFPGQFFQGCTVGGSGRLVVEVGK